MARLIQKKKEHIGCSPDTLVFKGEQKNSRITLTAFDYNTNDIREIIIKTHEELVKLKNSTETISWLNVDGLHDPKLMEEIAVVFNIPGNIISYIMDTSLRPQAEEFDDGLFVSLKLLKYDEKEEQITAESFSLIVTPYTIISFQEAPGKEFDPVRERLRKNKSRVREGGTDYLCFVLLDVVIDYYIYILGVLGDKIETIDERMDEHAGSDVADTINTYKRELNFLRKNIKPVKEMIMNLLKLDSDLIVESNKTHFMELKNNIDEANDLSDSYREMLNDQLNNYHTIAGDKLNDIMKILTIFSVVFIPLSFIVGVYGMNFKDIPGTNWEYGYIAIWCFFVLIVITMLWYFKRKKWF